MANRRRRDSQRSFSAAPARFSAWFTFFLGLLLGVLSGVGFYDRLGLGYFYDSLFVTKVSSSPIVQVAKQHSIPRKTGYDFYQLLSRQPKAAKGSSVAPTPHASPQERGSVYYLQVAALIEQGEVEKLKAQLSLLGFEVYVDQVKAEVNRYRVVVGPYATLAAVYHAQNMLKKNRYSGLLRRMDRVG